MLRNMFSLIQKELKESDDDLNKIEALKSKIIGGDSSGVLSGKIKNLSDLYNAKQCDELIVTPIKEWFQAKISSLVVVQGNRNEEPSGMLSQLITSLPKPSEDSQPIVCIYQGAAYHPENGERVLVHGGQEEKWPSAALDRGVLATNPRLFEALDRTRGPPTPSSLKRFRGTLPAGETFGTR